MNQNVIKKQTLLVIAVLLGSLCPMSAQEVALTRYFLAIQADLSETLNIDNQTLWGINTQSTNPQSVRFMDSTYNLVTQRINNETSIKILPRQAMEGSVKYTRMGYPFARLKKAAKSASFEGYLTLEVTLEGTGEVQTSTEQDVSIFNDGEVDFSLIDRELTVFPKVSITVELGDSNGKRTNKMVGVFRGDQTINIQSRDVSLGIFVLNMRTSSGQLPYYVYLNLALDDLIDQLNAL